ncbi:hypothetical protein KY343_01475 [Candidatus Woesearchaeota archaeon]|nr:hypothetical protein [Candidatus Woesearchaeota archaeon]
MVSEEQENFNEQEKRRREANGEEFQAVRNSEGGIENFVVDDYKGMMQENESMMERRARLEQIKEKQRDLFREEAVSSGGNGGGGEPPFYKFRPDDFREYVKQTIKQVDDSPWYKRAWSQVKAIFTGRSYEEIILNNKKNEVNKKLVDKVAEYERLRDEYQEDAEGFEVAVEKTEKLMEKQQILQQKIEDMKIKKGSKLYPMLAIQKDELAREGRYQDELAGSYRERMENHYEPLLQELGNDILGLKRIKISIDNALKGFHSSKKAYALQKCRV